MMYNNIYSKVNINSLFIVSLFIVNINIYSKVNINRLFTVSLFIVNINNKLC